MIYFIAFSEWGDIFNGKAISNESFTFLNVALCALQAFYPVIILT